MEPMTILQQLYAAVPPWAVAVSLGPAALSLLIRLVGLRRNYLVSRPRALVGLTAVVIILTIFYATQHLYSPPMSVEERGGFVRVLLILLGVALIHWNFDYLKWAVGKGNDMRL